MQLIVQTIPGLVLVEPKFAADARGDFVKTFHEEVWAEAGIRFELKEEFYSTSREGVIRGMHFQVPPDGHDKVVTCLVGSVVDVVVDLRAGSPTFGEFRSFELSAANRRVLFVPEGLAHGFVARVDGSLVHYKTSSVYSPQRDGGIRWDSFGFDWGVRDPMVSARDASFPPLSAFQTPFVYQRKE